MLFCFCGCGVDGVVRDGAGYAHGGLAEDSAIVHDAEVGEQYAGAGRDEYPLQRHIKVGSPMAPKRVEPYSCEGSLFRCSEAFGQSCRRSFDRVSSEAMATMTAVKTMERMTPGNPQARWVRNQVMPRAPRMKYQRSGSR